MMRIILICLFIIPAIYGCKEDDCSIPDQCNLAPDPGACLAAIPRYYFDKEENRCKEFTWGGCGEFPFETLEECKDCECND